MTKALVDCSKPRARSGDDGLRRHGEVADRRRRRHSHGRIAPVESDPAGSATLGTGSASISGEDRRSINATGQGLD